MMRLWVATALLLSSCVSAAAARADAGVIADTASIAPAGTFSNMRYTEEHAYGFTIMLWRVDGRLVGFLEHEAGLQGDAPIGELLDVRYDVDTGNLSFSAKLTLGLVTRKGSTDWEPSRDLLSFDGRLKAAVITGVMTRANQATPTPQAQDVILVRLQDEAPRAGDGLESPATHGEWRKRWQDVLKSRGPKW